MRAAIESLRAITQAASRWVTAILVMAKDEPQATTRPVSMSQSKGWDFGAMERAA